MGGLTCRLKKPYENRRSEESTSYSSRRAQKDVGASDRRISVSEQTRFPNTPVTGTTRRIYKTSMIFRLLLNPSTGIQC